ncbi:MAG: CDP-alcohol phosphatidyltransferase family protein [Anaerolineales bacterium]|nr:CDP-alcohol phosphatidyltransferase family protein [Anaerolineales bacterium]
MSEKGSNTVEQAREEKKKLTFTDQMRVRFRGVLDPIGAFFNRIGLMPNTMTILGLIGNTIGAFLLSQGQFTYGGLIILAMGPVDALDGTMARLRGEPSEFGAFVDSVTDRYSELVIFGGLLIYYVLAGDWVMALVTYFAASGSVMVSYIRARASSLGYDTKVGILTRMERYLVLAPTLVLGYPWVGLWIIAILANITALQRIWDIRVQTQGK